MKVFIHIDALEGFVGEMKDLELNERRSFCFNYATSFIKKHNNEKFCKRAALLVLRNILQSSRR